MAETATNASTSGPQGAARFAAALVGFAVLAWLLHELGQVLLVAFGGVLVAVLLTMLSAPLRDRFGGRAMPAVVLVVLVLAALFVLGGWLLAPNVAAQADALGERLPRALETIRDWLARFAWGRAMLGYAEDAPEAMVQGEASGAWSVLRGTLGAVLGGLSALAVMLLLGVFLAIQPALYRRGVLGVAPARWRTRLGRVYDTVGHTLSWWLVGRLISMVVIGVATTLGLLLLDVQLAPALGVIAALLTFVPNVGPVVSAVPAMLMALLTGPMHPLYVAALYAGVQLIESSVLEPYVERRTVNLAPALTVTMQLALGTLFGLIGVVMAAPLTAAGQAALKAWRGEAESPAPGHSPQRGDSARTLHP